MSADVIVPPVELPTQPGDMDTITSIVTFFEELRRQSDGPKVLKVVGDYGQGKTFALRYAYGKALANRTLAPALLEAAFSPYRGLAGVRRAMLTEANGLPQILRSFEKAAPAVWPNAAFARVHAKLTRPAMAKLSKAEKGALVALLAGQVGSTGVKALELSHGLTADGCADEDVPAQWIASLLLMTRQGLGRVPVLMLDELTQSVAAESESVATGIADLVQMLREHRVGCGIVLALTPAGHGRGFEAVEGKVVRLQGCREPVEAARYLRQVADALGVSLQLDQSGIQELLVRANHNWRDLGRLFALLVQRLGPEIGQERPLLGGGRVAGLLDGPSREPSRSTWVPEHLNGTGVGFVEAIPKLLDALGPFRYHGDARALIELMSLDNQFHEAGLRGLGLLQHQRLVALAKKVTVNAKNGDFLAALEKAGWLDRSDPGWWPLRLAADPALNREPGTVPRNFYEATQAHILALAIQKLHQVEEYLATPAFVEPTPI